MDSYTCYEKLNRPNLATLIQQTHDPAEKTLLAKMLKKLNKDNVMEVTYKCVNKDVGGRLYAAGGVSLQTTRKLTRAIISEPSWDFDIVNAYPQLLVNKCKQIGLPCETVQNYVDNRDGWFATGVTKLDVIKTLFGSKEPSRFHQIQALQKEVEDITDVFTTMYPDLHKAVKKLKPRVGEDKLERTLMSYILQGEEMKVMSKVLSKMKLVFPNLHIQAYIYDGFMVRKSDGVDPDEVLAQINSWVEGDNVTFCLKPFECPATFTPLRKEQLEIDEDDWRAFEAMHFMFPQFLKMNKGLRMVFNERTGQWAEDDPGPFYTLAHRAHPNDRYGSVVIRMRAMWELMITLPDDAEFFERAKLASIGKLLFTNGIFDKCAQARIDFTPDILFQARVTYPIVVLIITGLACV